VFFQSPPFETGFVPRRRFLDGRTTRLLRTSPRSYGVFLFHFPDGTPNPSSPEPGFDPPFGSLFPLTSDFLTVVLGQKKSLSPRATFSCVVFLGGPPKNNSLLPLYTPGSCSNPGIRWPTVSRKSYVVRGSPRQSHFTVRPFFRNVTSPSPSVRTSLVCFFFECGNGFSPPLKHFFSSTGFLLHNGSLFRKGVLPPREGSEGSFCPF